MKPTPVAALLSSKIKVLLLVITGKDNLLNAKLRDSQKKNFSVVIVKVIVVFRSCGR